MLLGAFSFVVAAGGSGDGMLGEVGLVTEDSDDDGKLSIDVECFLRIWRIIYTKKLNGMKEQMEFWGRFEPPAV